MERKSPVTGKVDGPYTVLPSEEVPIMPKPKKPKKKTKLKKPSKPESLLPKKMGGGKVEKRFIGGLVGKGAKSLAPKIKKLFSKKSKPKPKVAKKVKPKKPTVSESKRNPNKKKIKDSIEGKNYLRDRESNAIKEIEPPYDEWPNIEKNYRLNKRLLSRGKAKQRMKNQMKGDGRKFYVEKSHGGKVSKETTSGDDLISSCYD